MITSVQPTTTVTTTTVTTTTVTCGGVGVSVTGSDKQILTPRQCGRGASSPFVTD